MDSIRRGYGLPQLATQVAVLLISLAGGLQVVRAAEPASSDGAKTSVKQDWSGVWVFEGDFLDTQTGDFLVSPGRIPPGADSPMPPEPMPKFKGKYLDILKARIQALKEGKPIGDSGAMCRPQGMPRFWLGPYSFEIVQSARQINLFQEWNEQTRRIYLDGRPHPKDADPTYNGHSVGHWEGGVLVVDTSGIREDTGIGQEDQASHSDVIHVVERFTLVSPDHLEVEMRATDVKAFAEPWVAKYRLHRKSGMEIEEYNCVDNNRNPVDANGVTGTILHNK